MGNRLLPFRVIAGPVPAIHGFTSWMPGTSPGLTLCFDQEA
jgi:hypothetical protein